jgi:hypothetical protein
MLSSLRQQLLIMNMIRDMIVRDDTIRPSYKASSKFQINRGRRVKEMQ